MANHLCNHIGKVAGEIIVGNLCTKYRCTQISNVDWERGNWPTTCMGKSWLDTCELSTGTRKYLKATRNREAGQPPMHSNLAGGWGNYCRTTVY
ncbi:unnamed protein product [Prunus armeniaca]|uniref:Uncharacterized protein n=1 Tax=Prunus armeniaca TaxID=36596 RepID=A0A6J5VDM8_PRUAR|nr:unnamed protein product [Prunus armeniaca]